MEFMNDKKVVFDKEYFRRQAIFWFDTHNRMMQFRTRFNVTEDLPELSRGLSPELSQLIPALNQAKSDMSHNMIQGANAVREFGNGLIETGKSYGLTEDDATKATERLH